MINKVSNPITIDRSSLKIQENEFVQYKNDIYKISEIIDFNYIVGINIQTKRPKRLEIKTLKAISSENISKDISIFKDVYDEALKNVIEIINHAESHENIKYDELNNIIAFTGERGKGKSSSMISFKNALVDKSNKEKHYDFFIKKNEIVNKQFATFDIIDPSLFRKGESLFEIILAKMFDHCQCEIKKNNFAVSNDDRSVIISHFQKVFDNLQIINSDRRDLYKKDSIEVLSKMATSSNLRESFRELVSIYLQKFEKEKHFLVIAIDDFDLNISGAYDMLEDLRQFLIQSNIIILIACKVEQLKLTLLNYFYNEYELLVKYNSSKISELELINNTERYLEKLIPFSRRLLLPDVQSLQTIRFKVINNREIIFNDDGENFNKLIIKLIFENLNLLQTYNILNKNFIFPNTISMLLPKNRTTFLEDLRYNY